jgi:hypothetical protein
MKLFRPKFESDPRWQRDNWRALNQEAAATWTAVPALRATIADLTREALKRLGAINTPPGTPPTIENLKSEVRFKVAAVGTELAAAQMLLDTATASEQFKRAEKEFAPLVRQADERDAAEEKARLEKQRAEAALVRAREAATARALENVESDPDIVQAKRELAAQFAGEF